MKKTFWYVAVTVLTVAIAMIMSTVGTIIYLETRFTDRVNREINELKSGFDALTAQMEALIPQTVKITIDDQYWVEITLPAGNYTVTAIPQPEREAGAKPFLPPDWNPIIIDPDMLE